MRSLGLGEAAGERREQCNLLREAVDALLQVHVRDNARKRRLDSVVGQRHRHRGLIHFLCHLGHLLVCSWLIFGISAWSVHQRWVPT